MVMVIRKKLAIAITLMTAVFLTACQSVKNGRSVSPIEIIEGTMPVASVKLTSNSQETFQCIKTATLGGGPSAGFPIKVEGLDILWIGMHGRAIASVYAVDKAGLMTIYVTNLIGIQKEQKRVIGEECAKNKDWQKPNDFWDFMGMSF
jgi:nitrous oxide reductase accessory protein NosL